MFDGLHARRAQLKLAYGGPLTWDAVEGRKACRILEAREADDQREDEHQAYIAFFIDAGERMRRAIEAVDGAQLRDPRWPQASST